MEIGERIRYLRKNILHLTQDEFAPRIRISRSNVGNIETGRIGTTDRVIEDICNEFGVSEEWLKTGSGGDENIFIKATASEKAYNRFGYIMENAAPTKKAALSMLLELLYSVPDDKWDKIMEEYEQIKESIKKEG